MPEPTIEKIPSALSVNQLMSFFFAFALLSLLLYAEEGLVNVA
jgi:hypothetical protein